MATRRSGWVALLVVVGGLYGGWKVWRALFGDDTATPRLVNQVWIERMPRDERDMVYGAVLVEHDGKRIGVVGRGSRWRSHQDVFLWRQEGDTLRTRFPQDNQRYRLQVRTWECEGKAPRPFQLCLEARTGNRVLRFFSRKDWVIRPGEDAAAAGELGWSASGWERALEAAGREEVGEGPEAEGAGPFQP
jgi:hypothetical protein